jgi:hypothetical protein
MDWIIYERRGIWYVENTANGFKYLGTQPAVAINVAIKNGNMPADLGPRLLADADAIIAENTSAPPAPPPTPTEQTNQQNRSYIASGGIDDDSGSILRFDDGSSIQTFDDGSTLAIDPDGNTSSAPTPTPPPTSNAGTTQAGKSGTPAGKTSEQKPGKRPQNPLGNFSSYTYQLSLYMITPDAYDAFIQSGRKNINAFQDINNTGNGVYLIAQSGGINNTT